MSTNDETRQKILQYFYDRNTNASSRCGVRGSAVKIKALKSDLKDRHGLSGTEVQSKLTFIIDMGWVKTFDKQKAFQTARGTLMPTTTTWYEITAQGIKKIEGESEFDQPTKFHGINIEALGGSVVTVGTQNIVNVKYEETFEKLEQLSKKVTESEVLNEQEKANTVAEIQSLQSQLIKPTPNRDIVRAAWGAIKNTATVIGLGSDIMQLAPLISSLLT